MVHPSAAMTTFLANIVSQAPVIVQCPQPAPDSWLKWLLPTIVQTVVSLLSIGAGVAIAVWSFRKNHQSEHEQWVRDQKRAEWRELLMSTAEIQRVLRMGSMATLDRAREIDDKLKQAVHELSVASARCVFLQDFFSNRDKRSKFYSFLLEADLASESIAGMRSVLIRHRDELTQKEIGSTLKRLSDEANKITTRYLEFREWLSQEAARSLGAIIRDEDTSTLPPTPAS
jgi:hypothetical protein